MYCAFDQTETPGMHVSAVRGESHTLLATLDLLDLSDTTLSCGGLRHVG
jgi:hypothetical protein